MTSAASLRHGLPGYLPALVFVGVFAAHALYLRAGAGAPADGWADIGVDSGGRWGLAAYFNEHDYLLGFSYGLGASFGTWALSQYLKTRKAAMAAGAAGSITFVGVLMAAGCFLVGCCGSPMLGVYLGLFGAKALGIGKPLMAAITTASVIWGRWYLRRQLTCSEKSCGCLSGTSSKEG